MVVIGISLVVGFVVGRVLRLGRATGTRRSVHLLGVLVVGAGFGLAAELIDTSFGWPLTLASLALLTSFVIANLRLVGMPIVMVGLLGNVVVVVANEGMPVRTEALVAAGVADAESVDSLSLGGRRHLETDADRLAGLGDIIPVPPLREVVSFGDLIMAAGAADVAARLARRRRPARVRTRSRRDPRSEPTRRELRRERRSARRADPVLDLTATDDRDDEVPWWAESIDDQLDRPAASTTSP